ncbi:uncharacterized protein lrrc53 [Antennarius striatus]|uniref:uncharacterized protein lrrc53 n=1 Tax=Antennarius striatus TaxID=241820 RepID=UPI0035AF1EED
MVCGSTNNCVPSNRNSTIQIQSGDSVTPQLYARDLAITAIICFIGGIGLTLLTVLIYRVYIRKKLNRQKVEEEESGTMANHHVNHLDISGKKRDHFLQTNSSQYWDKEVTTLDSRTNGYSRQFRSRVNENSSEFSCPNCSSYSQRGMETNSVRFDSRTSARMEAEEDVEKRRVTMMTEEDKWGRGTHQGILGRDFPIKLLSHGNSNSSWHSRKETFMQRPEIGDSYRTEVDGKSKGHLQCKSCHRTYRPQGMIHNVRDYVQSNGFPSQYKQNDMGMNVGRSQSDMMKNTEFRRGSRNVTFDLERLRNLEQRNSAGRNKRVEEGKTSRDKEKRTHKAKVQSSRVLKVKLNLNPLRKSKVHSEKSSPKKSKDKRQGGKERQERDRKAKSDKSIKGSTEKVKKSKRPTEDVEKDVEKEDDQVEHKHQEKLEPCDVTNTADKSTPAVAIGQGQAMDVQGDSIQFQGAGLVLGRSQLSSQHHLSISATDKSALMSLSGPMRPQLAGQGLSLQKGNFMLNTMVPGSNAVFTSNLANPNPSIAISGPLMAPGGAPSLNRDAGLRLLTSATSALVNPLQASSITSPLHTNQPTGLTLSLPDNPAVHPIPGQSLSQTQLTSDSSATTRLQAEPAQGPLSLASKGVNQLQPESHAVDSKDPTTPISRTHVNVDGLPAVSTQAQGPGTTEDNLSNNNSQAGPGHAHAESMVNVTSGVVVLTEGLTTGVSEDHMHAADVSGGSTSTMSHHGNGSVLLQQEYVSEEGSSPRRKLRLVLPEKTSSRPPTALERKIR